MCLPPCDELVDEDAQSPDVNLAVVFLLKHNLRRHVERGSLKVIELFLILEHFGEPKVNQLNLKSLEVDVLLGGHIDQAVLSLEISVDNRTLSNLRFCQLCTIFYYLNRLGQAFGKNIGLIGILRVRVPGASTKFSNLISTPSD